MQVRSVKISVLSDNHAGTHCQAEHGLSYLIDFNGKKLLFDTGQSDLFLRNAGIMGGFHLKENDRQTKETINYLRQQGVRHILPSHCTELPALAAFHMAFGIKQVRTGDVINL